MSLKELETDKRTLEILIKCWEEEKSKSTFSARHISRRIRQNKKDLAEVEAEIALLKKDPDGSGTPEEAVR